MTEAEWLACDDPGKMLYHVTQGASNRRARLLAAACCRLSWHRISDWRCRQVVELAEAHADGLITDDELVAARSNIPNGRKRGIVALVRCSAQPMAAHAAWDALHLLRHILSQYLYDPQNGDESSPARAELGRVMRCLFCNPFRPVTFAPEWGTDTAVAIAAQMYESREFSAMPILADALQDAGCATDDILAHCRDPQQVHVRGCWVVDLVLGKK